MALRVVDYLAMLTVLLEMALARLMRVMLVVQVITMEALDRPQATGRVLEVQVVEQRPIRMEAFLEVALAMARLMGKSMVVLEAVQTLVRQQVQAATEHPKITRSHRPLVTMVEA
jgi:hypothetical protein